MSAGMSSQRDPADISVIENASDRYDLSDGDDTSLERLTVQQKIHELSSPQEIREMILSKVLRLINNDLLQRASATKASQGASINLQEKVREILIKRAIREWIVSNPLESQSIQNKIDKRTYDRLQAFAVFTNLRLILPEQKLLIELLKDLCYDVSTDGSVHLDSSICYETSQSDNINKQRQALNTILVNSFKDKRRAELLKQLVKIRTEIEYTVYQKTKTSNIPEVVLLKDDTARGLHYKFERFLLTTIKLSKNLNDRGRYFMNKTNSAIDQYVNSYEFNKPDIPEIELSPLQRFVAALWDW